MLAAVEIDDLLQETFLRAFRDIGSFQYESPGSFWNWLSSIANHVTQDAARFEGRQKRHADETVRFRSASNSNGADPADAKTPSLLLSEKEAVESLFRTLDALPEDYRQAIYWLRSRDCPPGRSRPVWANRARPPRCSCIAR